MSTAKKLPLSLTTKENNAGLIYVCVSLFLLPGLINTGNGYLPRPMSGVWLNFLYYCLNFVFLVALLHGFLRKHIVYAGKHLWQVLGYCVLGFLIYWVCNFVLSFGILKLFPDFSNINDGAIGNQLSQNFTVVAIGTVVLVPLAEELMHRALIFGSLYRTNPVAAYAVSMLFFGAVHVMGYVSVYPPLALLLSFIQYLPAGWVLAWCYRKSGCIFVPILIHTAINAMGILAMR